MKKPAITIASLIEEFLDYKRNMGYKYETGELYLKTFIKYLREKEINLNIPDKETVTDWCNKSTKFPGSLYNKISIIREFGRYLVLNGYEDAYVIPKKHGNRLEPHLPYFFTANEIYHFFEICSHMQKCKEYKGRELVIPELFKVLYCCGLRCREARMLNAAMCALKRGILIFFSQKVLKADGYLSAANSVRSLPCMMLKSDAFFLTGYISFLTVTISPTAAV